MTSGRDVHLRPKEQPVLKELTGLGMWALVEGAGRGWRGEQIRGCSIGVLSERQGTLLSLGLRP